MKTLSIDIESYSGYDLTKCGVYKYTESPEFEILLFGYSVDGGEVQIVDLACGETLPPEILDALTGRRSPEAGIQRELRENLPFPLSAGYGCQP